MGTCVCPSVCLSVCLSVCPSGYVMVIFHGSFDIEGVSLPVCLWLYLDSLF